jgi:hypothetical protein
MHHLFDKADGLSGQVIGAAIEVHRIMGPGLLESIYERCLLLVDGCLLVELKAIQDVLPVHKPQRFSYMRLLNAPLGLLFDFHEIKLADGISRLLLPGANKT